MTADRPLPQASAGETARLVAGVLAPMVAQGIILRRPRVVALAERLQVDRRAADALRRARDTHGPGPLQLRLPGRSVALVLDPGDVERLLVESPEPFAPATREKRAALAHFQPGGVLISSGEDRAVRRRWNESVLEMDRPLHSVGASLVPVVREEVGRLLAGGPDAGTDLDWDRFAAGWWRAVRRVVLGDDARDDAGLTDLLGELRGHGNWAHLHRTDDEARRRLLAAVDRWLERAQPGSLAAAVRDGHPAGRVEASSQVAHWLFAFDAAGIAAWRALALLAGHPAVLEDVRAELRDRDLSTPQELPLLRATVLESVRLWPTTLAVLRESTRDTDWRGRRARAGTTFVVTSSFFHRDPQTLAAADAFDPRAWQDGGHRTSEALVPFSGGPGRCPGRNLVLLTTSTLLAAVLAGRSVRQTTGTGAVTGRPLPRTMDHTALAFRLTPAVPAAADLPRRATTENRTRERARD